MSDSWTVIKTSPQCSSCFCLDTAGGQIVFISSSPAVTVWGGSSTQAPPLPPPVVKHVTSSRQMTLIYLGTRSWKMQETGYIYTGDSQETVYKSINWHTRCKKMSILTSHFISCSAVNVFFLVRVENLWQQGEIIQMYPLQYIVKVSSVTGGTKQIILLVWGGNNIWFR